MACETQVEGVVLNGASLSVSSTAAMIYAYPVDAPTPHG